MPFVKERPKRLKNRAYKPTAKYKAKKQAELEAIEATEVPFRKYEYDPIGFTLEVLGIQFLTDEQKQIMRSVVENTDCNVKSCHGIGKTKTSALLALWCVFAWGGLCVTTAPTKRQVIELLWGEIRLTHGANHEKLGGELGQTFLRLSENWRAFGFTARSNDSNSFQGIHKPRMLLILDEACGITKDISDAAKACLTGDDNKILRVGNPIAAGTPFEAECNKNSITVAAWTHPNVAWAYQQDSDGIHRIKKELRPYLFGEDGKTVLDRKDWGEPALEAMRSHLEQCGAVEIRGAISVKWIENTARPEGEGSAFWVSRVEGEFPLDSDFSIIPRRYFIMARAKYDEMAQHHPEELAARLKLAKHRYGLDVGDGGDPHALSHWQKNVCIEVKHQPTIGDELDTGRAAAMVLEAMATHGKGAVAVDKIGVGAGALYVLKQAGVFATGIHWGKAASDPDQYANLKAEQFWVVRQALERGEVMIAPLGIYEEELKEDLAQTCYEYQPTGKIKIEDKKKTKEKLGRSTNLGDAFIYGFFAALTGAGLIKGIKR